MFRTKFIIEASDLVDLREKVKEVKDMILENKLIESDIEFRLTNYDMRSKDEIMKEITDRD